MENQYKERLWSMVHKAIGDCCVQDGKINTWLLSPMEVERRLMEVLTSQIGEPIEFAGEKVPKTKEEVIQQLAVLGSQLKLLLKAAQKSPKGISLSEVELDVARAKAKLEILDWVDDLELHASSEAAVAIKAREIANELELLEKVLCT